MAVDEVQEETGADTTNDIWRFTDDHFMFCYDMKGVQKHYFLKIVDVEDTTDANLWRPAFRPKTLGEVAGVVWLSLSNNYREFPFNMRSAVMDFGHNVPDRYINHAVIWQFCQILSLRYENVKFNDLSGSDEFYQIIRETIEKFYNPKEIETNLP